MSVKNRNVGPRWGGGIPLWGGIVVAALVVGMTLPPTWFHPLHMGTAGRGKREREEEKEVRWEGKRGREGGKGWLAAVGREEGRRGGGR